MERTDLTLVVMAAGIGSRYGGLKQVDPVGPCGEIILDYSAYDALKAGFTKIVFVISKAIEQAFREQVGKTIVKHCNTNYVFQRLEDVPAGFQVPANRVKPWGTGHATLTSRSEVDSPFAVINADDYYGQTAYRAIADYLRGARDLDGVADYCMVGYHLGNTLTEHGYVARGVCSVDGSGNLVYIRERVHIERDGQSARYTEDGQQWVTLPLETTVSMNLWGFTPSIFSVLADRFPRFLAENRGNIEKAEYFLPNVVGDLIQEKRARVRVLATGEKWHGVTYPQDKAEVKAAVQEMIRRGVYPENLWAGMK